MRWLEAELPGAVAAFSTRAGGVSEPPFDTLNLGISTGDERDVVRQNRRRAAEAIGVESSKVILAGRQVHGAELAWRDEAPSPNGFAEPGSGLGEADGQATSTPGLAPLVFVADCLPVALSGERGVAMIHCGWRGLAAGIVQRGVEAVGATAAAIGPGIGPCCYEVGDEVLDVFEFLGPGVAAGRMLDLRGVANRLLDRAGVDRIEVSDLCTSCNPELFFSHRRDGGRTGRQAGVVWSVP